MKRDIYLVFLTETMPIIRYLQCWLRYKGTILNYFRALEEHVAPRAGSLADHKQRGTRLSLPRSFSAKQYFFLSQGLAWIPGCSDQAPRAPTGLAAPACRRLPPPSSWPRTMASHKPLALAPAMLQKGQFPAPKALPLCLRLPNVAHHCCRIPPDHTENEIKAERRRPAPAFLREAVNMGRLPPFPWAGEQPFQWSRSTKPTQSSANIPTSSRPCCSCTKHRRDWDSCARSWCCCSRLE